MSSGGLYVIIAVVVVAGAVLFVRHQRALCLRAELMKEAIRNRDFTFRLPTHGLLKGERAIQDTLNQLGDIIREQVNRHEVEAWERLTRVLTHEIMNATAPIASISQSLLGRQDVKGTPLEEAVQAIHTASDHLITFVDSYRKLSQLQNPVPEAIDLASLLNDVGGLFPRLEKDISLREAAPVVQADPGMMRQVLINLLKNAEEAGAKTVTISADGQRLYVGNDGKPIPAIDRSSVFVPFFTTKQNGSGIGLYLCRRMMILQGGMLELAEKSHGPCYVTFVLTLPTSAPPTSF